MGKWNDKHRQFWSKVNIADGDKCWEWNGGVRGDGYGAIRVNYKQIGAHRYSYELTYGAIPPGLHVLHRCDNPLCVRPDHLFLGTNRDNVNDRAAKGRNGRSLGARHWSKLHPNHPWLADRCNYRKRGGHE